MNFYHLKSEDKRELMGDSVINLEHVKCIRASKHGRQYWIHLELDETEKEIISRKAVFNTLESLKVEYEKLMLAIGLPLDFNDVVFADSEARSREEKKKTESKIETLQELLEAIKEAS